MTSLYELKPSETEIDEARREFTVNRIAKCDPLNMLCMLHNYMDESVQSGFESGIRALLSGACSNQVNQTLLTAVSTILMVALDRSIKEDVDSDLDAWLQDYAMSKAAELSDNGIAVTL